LFHVYAYQNLGYVNLLENNPKEALKYLELAEKSPLKSYKKDFLNIIYNQISIAYEDLGLLDKALIYKNKKDSLSKLLDKNEKDKLLILENYKHHTAYKNQQITTLTQKFNQHKILYLTLISLVFLLALYSFIRWKKEDRKKKMIEDEKTKIESEKAILEVTHHQTIEELQKTKELVIEDHIVLKNNAKIYLEKLLYIKAEDHYLELITTTKKEFVRGKISEIRLELPPNFVKCHRSFIVNINYISIYLKTEVKLENGTLIPLSRGFVFK
jgi:tetratricopeptide (TPR) repeat protein